MIYRELSAEEFDKAPREVDGSNVFTPENSKILAAINENGEIVATWTFFICAHIEPVWIREDYRGKGMILGRLGNAMKAMLRSLGIADAYTVVLDKTPVLRKFAYWFGAKPVDGILFKWSDPNFVSVTGEE
jgi:hypothetical protein